MSRGLAAAVPGMKVQLTGYFLKATGQVAGSEGDSVWTVVECRCGLCRNGGFACTNERLPEELHSEGATNHRHIALANLQQVGKLPKTADLPEQIMTESPGRRKK